MYPGGFTKGEMFDYYASVAPALLRHLAGRPLTVVRYPHGVMDESFFVKHCPDHRPEWVQTAKIGGRGGEVNFCLCEDLPTLTWLTQLASIELHPSLGLAKSIDHPTALALDLDPGPPANVIDAARIGIVIRDLFADLGIRSFPKTTGGKGLHVYVPLDGSATYEQTKPFAKGLAKALESSLPDLVVSKQLKKLRKGKVLVDWSQNDPGKTTIAAYSLRGRDRPTVSTPVSWDEVEAAITGDDPDALVFEAAAVKRRLEKHGDLFAPVLDLDQTLPDEI